MLPALLGRDFYLRCIRTNIRPPPPLAPAFRECTDRSSCKPALESEHSRPATLAARFYGCSKSGCEFVRAARRALANGLPPSRAGVLVCRRVAARRATNAATRRPAGVRAVSASRDGGRLFTHPVDAAPGALACATRGHTHGSAGLRSLAVSMSTRGLLAPRTLHSWS
jgi:hypothetical protein